MNPRTFGFEYIMIARNADEQEQIENIIKTIQTWYASSKNSK